MTNPQLRIEFPYGYNATAVKQQFAGRKRERRVLSVLNLLSTLPFTLLQYLSSSSSSLQLRSLRNGWETGILFPLLYSFWGCSELDYRKERYDFAGCVAQLSRFLIDFGLWTYLGTWTVIADEVFEFFVLVFVFCMGFDCDDDSRQLLFLSVLNGFSSFLLLWLLVPMKLSVLNFLIELTFVQLAMPTARMLSYLRSWCMRWILGWNTGIE